MSHHGRYGVGIRLHDNWWRYPRSLENTRQMQNKTISSHAVMRLEAVQNLRNKPMNFPWISSQTLSAFPQGHTTFIDAFRFVLKRRNQVNDFPLSIYSFFAPKEYWWVVCARNPFSSLALTGAQSLELGHFSNRFERNKIPDESVECWTKMEFNPNVAWIFARRLNSQKRIRLVWATRFSSAQSLPSPLIHFAIAFKFRSYRVQFFSPFALSSSSVAESFVIEKGTATAQRCHACESSPIRCRAQSQ